MRVITGDLITKDECLTSDEVNDYIKNFSHNCFYYVYFLVNPFNYKIKYVGKGKRILTRIQLNYYVR